jgi:hypothetical protein
MHVPAGPQVPVHASAAPHSPRRSTPTGSSAQRPTEPGNTQLWHRSVQALSQQTPSLQWPVGQSASRRQCAMVVGSTAAASAGLATSLRESVAASGGVGASADASGPLLQTPAMQSPPPHSG